MTLKSLVLEFSIECGNCAQPLPVNKAAECIRCAQCGVETETPQPLWQALVTEQLIEATKMEPETDTWANGMMAGVGSYRMTYGNKSPRCRKCGALWDPKDLLKIGGKDPGLHTCKKCGSEVSLRRPPEWFDTVVPHACLLVGETTPDEERHGLEGATSISIFCYHCGSALPLDGSSRTVRCQYCNGDFLVPDDIWARLNPVATPRPWYVIIDLGDAAGLLAKDIDDFVDLAALPGNDIALLWEEEGEYCIGRADGTGLLRWVVRGIRCSDYARLCHVPASKTLWVLDHDEEVVHLFDAEKGKRIRSIENEDYDPDLIAVIDHRNVAVCSDDTAVVYRRWGNADGDSGAAPVVFHFKEPHVITPEELAALKTRTGLWEMRRFDRKGKRIPLWEGSVDGDLHLDVPSWKSMPDRPAEPPEDAFLEAGPDGTLYMVDPGASAIARYDRAGKCLGVIRPDAKVVREVEDLAVAGDGSVYIVFNHRKKIGSEEWSDVGRIGLDGALEVIAGPHAPVHDHSIGTWVRRISVTPEGAIHLCGGDFNNLRALNPDGSTIWRSPGTIVDDEDLAEELAEARKKRTGGRE